MDVNPITSRLAQLPTGLASPGFPPNQQQQQTQNPSHNTPGANDVRSLASGQSPMYLANLSNSSFSPTYSQFLSSSLAQSLDGLDPDIMKRPFDTSTLPANPMNGMQPQIDSSSSNVETFPPKKARYDASAQPSHIATPGGQTHFGGNKHFTPGQFGMGGSNNGFTGTPLNLGGPLHQTPQQTHGMGQPGSATGNGMQGTPFGMMNGLNGMMGMGGFGMGGFPLNMNMQNYPGSPIVSPSMNPNTMTGNYGPAAAAAAAAAAGNTTGRTVYVGNLPSEASVDELLNLVRFGPIETVRLLPEKSCVFISFLDGSTAAAFHADASVKKLALHGQELKIGWGKPSVVHPNVQAAVANSQATRNVFVGNLDPEMNEQGLRNELSKFGPIDQVKIVRDKNIGFIHFLSIGTAVKVVNQLPGEPGWEGKRVNYGKDRCAYVPKAQQDAVRQAQTQAMTAVASQHSQMPGTPFSSFSPMTAGFGGFGTPASAGFGSPLFGNGFPSAGGSGFMDSNAAGQVGNRTVYLGNIHPDTTIEELCNNVRGGMLQQIKYLPEKHIAFITFVDPAAAMQFYQHGSTTGLMVTSRRLKVGWGKASGPLTPPLLQAIQSGASRNVYIGQIADFSLFTEAKLRQDFGEFGEIDMINFLNEKGAAFVNFTSIQNAQKAIEGIKLKPEYSTLRISYGKDRCANPPRASHQTPGGNKSRHVSDQAPKEPIVQNNQNNVTEEVEEGGLQDGDFPIEDDDYLGEELTDVPASFE
ncbi:uncharacterized protein I303_103437 [Kwoniella dejecticola CBS 10117]|uniref:Cytoplasmic protein n=1 Tax=Kwoniella dejecticola CBS 10117 TaxID=1296121 RepID=A0A1A6A6T1_9TREE|nr:cytoplasmic protein [Kwoniella dejecticola CBS 10117]OBR85748.1 cytoplasmic protein [Kwoniella dejecticola CBS 10117]